MATIYEVTDTNLGSVITKIKVSGDYVVADGQYNEFACFTSAKEEAIKRMKADIEGLRELIDETDLYDEGDLEEVDRSLTGGANGE